MRGSYLWCLLGLAFAAFGSENFDTPRVGENICQQNFGDNSILTEILIGHRRRATLSQLKIFLPAVLLAKARLREPGTVPLLAIGGSSLSLPILSLNETFQYALLKVSIALNILLDLVSAI